MAKGRIQIEFAAKAEKLEMYKKSVDDGFRDLYASSIKSIVVPTDMLEQDLPEILAL